MTSTATWATTADVVTFTGKTVTAEVLRQAEAQIELKVGLLADPTLTPGVIVKPRDLEFLKRAVAYQAAWLAPQPDAFDRSEVVDLSQDGSSVTFKAESITYAPFAVRALRRLSWKGTRSISTRSQDEGKSRLRQLDDDSLPWGPFEGDTAQTSSQQWAPLP